ncbi:hypothetical protein [Bradyrhizobium sp.]|uniref:hypothetical protein n=1 Tax=Bradyrhizobium sp. TaxID=376 RepID=UPI003C754450
MTWVKSAAGNPEKDEIKFPAGASGLVALAEAANRPSNVQPLNFRLAEAATVIPRCTSVNHAIGEGEHSLGAINSLFSGLSHLIRYPSEI